MIFLYFLQFRYFFGIVPSIIKNLETHFLFIFILFFFGNIYLFIFIRQQIRDVFSFFLCFLPFPLFSYQKIVYDFNNIIKTDYILLLNMDIILVTIFFLSFKFKYIFWQIIFLKLIIHS